MARRRHDEPPPPAEYIEKNLEPGDEVRCSGCNAPHVLVADRNDKAEVDWNFSPVCHALLAKGAPISAYVCETDGRVASKRCHARALKRMQRCAGCGLGPRDPHPGRDDEWSDRMFPPTRIGDLCSWCEDALAAGYAALAGRGEVTWRILSTREMFGIEKRNDEGAVPGEAFDALRTAANALAKLAAGPNLRAAESRWDSPLSWGDEAPSVPDVDYTSSSDPLAELDDRAAALLVEIGEAVGRAISLTQEESHAQGASVLRALLRVNVDSNPYQGLLGD